jgi:predicted Zn-dependent peptidase
MSARGLVAIGFLVGLLGAAADVGAEVAVSRHVLANGMRVLVRQDPTAEVVAAVLLTDAGTRLEAPATAGITNLLVRTMLRGSTRRSASQLAEATEDLGGRLDARGEVGYAEIRGEALARQWEPLLRLLAEVTLEPRLAVDEVQKERRLVLSQIRTRADTPFPFTYDALMRALYGEHPFAWPGPGVAASVERLSREALVDHYVRMMRADRLVLAVSGGVPRARVVTLAEQLFRGVRVPPAAALPPAVEPAPAGDRRVVERRAHRAQILMGFLGPHITAPDYPAVRVLGALLGGGLSGRLFTELREKRGLAYSLGVVSPFRAGPGLVAAYLGTAPDNVAVAEAGMLGEIDRLRREPASDAELARAKAYLLGRLAMDRRTNARQAWHLAFFELAGVGWDFSDRYERAVDAVTASDVRAAAARYLARPTTVVLQPPR